MSASTVIRQTVQCLKTGVLFNWRGQVKALELAADLYDEAWRVIEIMGARQCGSECGERYKECPEKSCGACLARAVLGKAKDHKKPYPGG